MNFLFPVLLFFDLVILKILWKSDVEERQIFVLKKNSPSTQVFDLKKDMNLGFPLPPIYLVLL